MQADKLETFSCFSDFFFLKKKKDIVCSNSIEKIFKKNEKKKKTSSVKILDFHYQLLSQGSNKFLLKQEQSISAFFFFWIKILSLFSLFLSALKRLAY